MGSLLCVDPTGMHHCEPIESFSLRRAWWRGSGAEAAGAKEESGTAACVRVRGVVR